MLARDIFELMSPFKTPVSNNLIALLIYYYFPSIKYKWARSLYAIFNPKSIDLWKNCIAFENAVSLSSFYTKSLAKIWAKLNYKYKIKNINITEAGGCLSSAAHLYKSIPKAWLK